MKNRNLILSPGDQIAGFRIIKPLAAGGMAVVYEAEQESLKRRVALKVLNERLGRDDSFRERFVREGMSIAALEHPNIVPVHDAGEDDGRLFIAMRFIEGDTLGDVLASRRLDSDEIVELLSPIAAALDAAHAAGIVHRDIKPGNILIDSKGTAYLADFGIARSTTASHTLTAVGSFIGSVPYASPEQASGMPSTAASDVYSLAVVLFQCVTGKLPYVGEDEAAILAAHLEAPIPRIRSEADSDDEVDAVFAKGLAKSADDRFESATALINAFASARAELIGESTTESPTMVDSTVLISPLETTVPMPVPAPDQAITAPDQTIVLDSTTVDPTEAAPASRKPKTTGTREIGVGVVWAVSAVLVVAAVAIGVVRLSGSDSAGAGTESELTVDGRELFIENCAGCHALSDALAVGTIGPDLDSIELEDPEINSIITNGKGGMPAFKDTLEEWEIAAIATYVWAVEGS